MAATHNVGHFYNNPAGYINIVLPNRHCHKGSGEAPGIPGNQHNDNPSFRGSNPDNHLLHQADRTCSVIFLLGLTGSWSIHLTFRKAAARNRFFGTVLMLFMISYFTEKMKIFIPGRHYSFPECLESFLFGILGCICITFLLYHLRRIASRPPEK